VKSFHRVERMIDSHSGKQPETSEARKRLTSRVSVIAGRNFAERLSSVLLFVCLPVVLHYVIMNTDPRSSLFSEAESVFLAAMPWTSDWKYHPIGWACKGFVFGLFGRFLLSPFARWLYTGRL